MAAARVIPGVWGVLESSSVACTIFTPCSFQSMCISPSPTRLIQFADPDIAIADGLALVAMRLDFDGSARKCFVEGLADVQRFAFQLKLVLHQHSVEEDGDRGRDPPCT